jgi:hypothetical protein
MPLPIAAVTGLITLGKNIIGGWLQRRATKVAHKVKMSEMKLELKEKTVVAQLNADIDIDKINTESMATSWKDEFLLIIFSIPVVMCFIPGMDGYVMAGFTALGLTPVWFQVIYIVMCLTIYGHRKLARLFAAKALGGKINGGD